MKVAMMFRPWTSPEGVQHTPGMVDRDAYPEIPDECFLSEWRPVAPRPSDIARLRAALLALRDTDDEHGDVNRLPGPCWCPAWVGTRRGGHIDTCLQARAAIGVAP